MLEKILLFIYLISSKKPKKEVKKAQVFENKPTVWLICLPRTPRPTVPGYPATVARCIIEPLIANYACRWPVSVTNKQQAGPM